MIERQGLPRAVGGMAIGLLGGSFDPAHEGHLHISHEALKRLRLDRVWWLVSPGNPLKPSPPAPLAERVERARRLVGHDPRIVVSDLEARLGTRATADTLERLRALYPGVRFVWLMGADNLAQLHLWGRWRTIMDSVPVAVLARPGLGLDALGSKAARAYGDRRERRAGRIARGRPPVWGFVNLPLSDASSTAIRERGEWKTRKRGDD